MTAAVTVAAEAVLVRVTATVAAWLLTRACPTIRTTPALALALAATATAATTRTTATTTIATGDVAVAAAGTAAVTAAAVAATIAAAAAVGREPEVVGDLGHLPVLAALHLLLTPAAALTCMTLALPTSWLQLSPPPASLT